MAGHNGTGNGTGGTGGGSFDRCGARTRDGDPCVNPPVTGRNRCRMHGGATPRGMALPQFKNGLRSRTLPPQLIERYEEALVDSELLSLRSDVALLTSLLDDKLRAWAEMTEGPDWQNVFQQIDMIVASYRVWDWTRAEQELQALADTVKARRNEAAVVDEIRSLIDQRTRIAQAEHRRLFDLNQVLTVEQVVTLASAMAAIIREEIPDPVLHARLEGRFARLLSIPEGRLRP